MSVMMDLTEKFISWEGVKDVCVWSVGGRHFRSICGISTVCTHMMKQLCQLSDYKRHNHVVDCCFGLASHFKNQCDGAQAHCRQLLDQVSRQTVVSDIPTMIRGVRALYDTYRADPGKPPAMPAHWHDYFPLEHKSVFWHNIAPNSFRAVSQCQSAHRSRSSCAITTFEESLILHARMLRG